MQRSNSFVRFSKKLSNMFPFPPFPDVRNRSLGNTILPSKGSLWDRREEDFFDILFSQFSSTSPDAPRPLLVCELRRACKTQKNSVLNIPRSRDPFQVGQRAMEFIPVDMICYVSFRTRPHKGSQKHSMDRMLPLFFPWLLQANTVIACRSHPQFHDAERVFIELDAPDSSEIRNFVKAFIADNGPPFFFEDKRESRLYLHREPILSGVRQPGVDASRLPYFSMRALMEPA